MSFVCEYLGVLEPLKHLFVDLSREKPIKVLILFLTIEIAGNTSGVKDPLSICNTRLP